MIYQILTRVMIKYIKLSETIGRGYRMGYPKSEPTETPVVDRPRGSVKHPFIAWLLTSARITALALRYPGKPMKVDYSTGDVWMDRG